MSRNAPSFKMDRVRGDLPPDPKPIGRKGRPGIYAQKLVDAVTYWERATLNDENGLSGEVPNPWWLICEHSNRRGSQAVLGRIRRGEVEVPAGTEWEFETREARNGKGRLYGRLLSVGS